MELPALQTVLNGKTLSNAITGNVVEHRVVIADRVKVTEGLAPPGIGPWAACTSSPETVTNPGTLRSRPVLRNPTR